MSTPPLCPICASHGPTNCYIYENAISAYHSAHEAFETYEDNLLLAMSRTDSDAGVEYERLGKHMLDKEKALWDAGERRPEKERGYERAMEVKKCEERERRREMMALEYGVRTMWGVDGKVEAI